MGKKKDLGQKVIKKVLDKKALFAVVSILALIFISFGSYSLIFSKKIFLNQYVGEINLGGKTKDEALKILGSGEKEFIASPIKIKSNDTGKTYDIDPTSIGLNFDKEKTVANSKSYGRNSNILLALFEQAGSLFYNRKIEVIYSINEDALSQKISEIAKELDRPEKDYALVYKNRKFELSTDRNDGVRIDQADINRNIKLQIAGLKKTDYSFSLNKFSPQVSEKNATARLNQANAVLGDIILKYDTQEFIADSDAIAGFLSSNVKKDDLEITLNSDRIKAFISSLAKSLDVGPENARLAVINGKVTVIGASRLGTTLDESDAKISLENVILARLNNGEGGGKIVTLKVSTKKPDVSENDIVTAGIVELIGTAFTNFKGSPVNRVHNITTGAAALNGVLLKPGEEFSTLGHLGKIDGSNGYLPELVIKDDSTVPEYGGGLCQVSSTLFRASLKAGMKITERQNHKYRVGYYEPPVGMDASIYDPSPDFKFINNYISYVLIQSKIEGTKITFELYGTKDARKVEVSEPTVGDYVDPGAPIIVETDTLPAGERKQLEKAHQGATAIFSYKVTNAIGEVLQEKTFKSKYVPWPEKWLVGKGTVPAPSCTDGAQNGDETGVDCGGSCGTVCNPL